MTPQRQIVRDTSFPFPLLSESKRPPPPAVRMRLTPPIRIPLHFVTAVNYGEFDREPLGKVELIGRVK